jgi:branched-chain amino acid transport system permease protein
MNPRPCGDFIDRYDKDMPYVHTRAERVVLLAVLVLAVLLPFYGDTAWTNFAANVGISLIVVLGLQVMTGYGGLVSVGQSAFVGIGAFVTAMLAARYGLPFYVAIPLAALATALLALIFSVPAGRIHGFYFALTTLAAQVLFGLVVVRLPSEWFGATEGLTVRYPSLFGFVFNTPERMYFLVLPTVLILVIVAINIIRSRVGRAFVAVRDNDLAAGVTGINVFTYRVLAFSVAAFFGGVAGGLSAYKIGFVSADQFTLFQSIWFVAMLIVGGQGSILGAIFGTVALSLLEEFVSRSGPTLSTIVPGAGPELIFPLLNLLLGATMILFLIVMPRGIVHLYNRFDRRLRLWPFPY